MGNRAKWAIAVTAAMGLLLAASGPAESKSAYSKAESKPCSFCHVGKTGDKVFTDAGKFYALNHTLAGFGEKAKAPAEAPAKAAPAAAAEPAAVPVPASVPTAAAESPAGATAVKEAEKAEMPMAEKEAPCECKCPCKEKRCTECGRMHDMGGMPPMMERMGGHLEEMKKAVSDLRESEKKLEAMKEPEAFRAAVLDHLKKLDDLQESHLKHMDSMMDARHGGKEGPPHRHCR